MPFIAGWITSRMILAWRVGVIMRCGRIGAHAAGIGPLVALLEALVILAGGERQHMVAVGHDNKADFLAFEKLFDHDPRGALPSRV